MNNTKICSKCEVTLPITSFYRSSELSSGYQAWCKDCTRKYQLDWRHKTGRQTSMSENKTCAKYLGIHIAERVLEEAFSGFRRMPENNPGFDFICPRGHKIDAKASCLSKEYRSNAGRIRRPSWNFKINKNKIADYFLLMGFTERDSLKPKHIWLVPSNKLSDKCCFTVTETHIEKLSEFEWKTKRVQECCNQMKSIHG